MDYLILLLVTGCVLILLIVHQDIIQFGEGYNKAISQLFPKLRSVKKPMKNAITLGCVVLFCGVFGYTFTEDDSWMWNGLMFAVVPPLVQLVRGNRKQPSG
jgi:hypothetical protein